MFTFSCSVYIDLEIEEMKVGDIKPLFVKREDSDIRDLMFLKRGTSSDLYHLKKTMFGTGIKLNSDNGSILISASSTKIDHFSCEFDIIENFEILDNVSKRKSKIYFVVSNEEANIFDGVELFSGDMMINILRGILRDYQPLLKKNVKI